MLVSIASYGKLDSRLIDACIASITDNAPEATVHVRHPQPAFGALDRFPPKVEAWCDDILHQDDDLLLLDADTLVLRDPALVFRGKFDLAHCPRPGRYKLNTGVLFVRPNARTRAFARHWLKRTYCWTATPSLISRAKAEHAGTDQAAFADALAVCPDLRVHEIPYVRWNLCQDFAKFSRFTGIAHFKGRVHRSLLRGHAADEGVPRTLVRAWEKYCEQR